MRPPHAEMNCPRCQQEVEPMRGSTWVFALYACPKCNHCWSATLTNGKPVAVVTADVQETA